MRERRGARDSGEEANAERRTIEHKYGATETSGAPEPHRVQSPMGPGVEYNAELFYASPLTARAFLNVVDSALL